MARRKSATGVEQRLAARLKQLLKRLNSNEDALDDLRYIRGTTAAEKRQVLLEEAAQLEIAVAEVGGLLEDEFGWTINDRGEMIPPR